MCLYNTLNTDKWIWRWLIFVGIVKMCNADMWVLCFYIDNDPVLFDHSIGGTSATVVKKKSILTAQGTMLEKKVDFSLLYFVMIVWKPKLHCSIAHSRPFFFCVGKKLYQCGYKKINVFLCHLKVLSNNLRPFKDWKSCWFVK